MSIPATLNGSPTAHDFEEATDASSAAEVAGFGTPDGSLSAQPEAVGFRPVACEGAWQKKP